MGGTRLEWVEKIWCGWNTFVVGGANLEWMLAEQCGGE